MAEQLKRELGVAGATFLGLGSMVGTGVFVSLSVAAGLTGPSVILALALAAGLAACNALSSAQLAAAHPVSGGTYEYGYSYLRPLAGFTAGWMFLIAKSASAATAALGVSGYLLAALAPSALGLQIHVAMGTVALVAIVVLAGIRRTAAINATIVSVTIATLLFFVAVTLPRFELSNFQPFFAPAAGRHRVSAFLYAAALSFVAYTGYGRIATLGEEVKNPKTTIPKAIATTVVVTFVLYLLVIVSGIGQIGTSGLERAVSATGAPLEVAAVDAIGPVGRWVLAVGASTALLGVLLNLILGLSRVVLAMARRRDMPRFFERLSRSSNPSAAVVAVSLVVALLTLLGDIRIAWSFSAVTVLVYYALTNLSALALPAEHRLFPKWVSWLGLIGCIGLAAFVDATILWWALGAALAGLLWFGVADYVRRRSARA